MAPLPLTLRQLPIRSQRHVIHQWKDKNTIKRTGQKKSKFQKMELPQFSIRPGLNYSMYNVLNMYACITVLDFRLRVS